MRAALALLLCWPIWPAYSEDAAALGRRALIVLSQGSEAKDAELRALAATAWGEIGNKAALPLLRKALKDPSPHVRIEAAYSLWRLADADGLAALESTIKVSNRLKLRKTPAQELRDLARNKVRAEAVGRLGDIGGEKSVAILEKTLNDPSPLVREATRIALVKLGFDEYADEFVSALADPDEGVRAAAARAIAQIGRPLAVSSLKRAAQDPSPAVRSEAFRALAASPEAGIFDVLARGARDKDKAARSAAVAAMARVPGQGATDLLYAVASDTGALPVAFKATAALASRGQKIDLGVIRAALRVKNPELAAGAIEVLASDRDAAALGPLGEIMDDAVDPRSRLRAAALLVKRLARPEGAQ